MNSTRDRHEIDVELVEYLVVVVPNEVAGAVVIESALDLARDEVVALLDVVIVSRIDGNVHVGELPELSGGAPALLQPGLISEGDVDLIASEIPVDRIGVVIVVEDRWAEPLSAAARRVGSYVAGGDRIPSRQLHWAHTHEHRREGSPSIEEAT